MRCLLMHSFPHMQDQGSPQKWQMCKAANPQTRRMALLSLLPLRMLPEPSQASSTHQHTNNKCHKRGTTCPSHNTCCFPILPMLPPLPTLALASVTQSPPTRSHACMPYTRSNVLSWGQTHQCSPSSELENLGLDTSPCASSTINSVTAAWWFSPLPTFPTSQCCMAVSFDTCNAIARFPGWFECHTHAWVGIPPGFMKPLPWPIRTCTCPKGTGFCG